jgi:hypothetical protein
VLRVFKIGRKDVHEVATLIRTVAQIPRMFVATERSVMVMRGAANDVAVVEWMLRQLDAPKGVAAQNTDGSRVVRFFPVANAAGILAEARKRASGIKIYRDNGLSLLVAVGTAAEVARASDVIRELNP